VKTLLFLLLTCSGGAAVGTVAVAGVSAALDPDSAAVEEFQQTDEPIEVLVYGERG
jgi:hypothetical protein